MSLSFASFSPRLQTAVHRFCRRYDLIDDHHSLFCAFFEKSSDLIGFYCIFATWHIDWLFVFRHQKNTEFQLIMQVFMTFFLFILLTSSSLGELAKLK